MLDPLGHFVTVNDTDQRMAPKQTMKDGRLARPCRGRNIPLKKSSLKPVAVAVEHKRWWAAEGCSESENGLDSN